MTSLKRQAVLVTKDFKNNSIFTLDGPLNRDNCLLPFHMLQQAFISSNIELQTHDQFEPHSCKFELHLDVQPNKTSLPRYLIMLETPYIHPPNGSKARLSQYRRVFTWNDLLLDNERYIKINFPINISTNPVDGYQLRPYLTAMIAGNKSALVPDSRNLYRERISVIRWFEQNEPKSFRLYGTDWNIPPIPSGLFGKFLRLLLRRCVPFTQYNPFPSYKGVIANKSTILKHTRFSFCYENFRDIPGYITEKIFDSFTSGCVPIYLGANNISDHIPDNCYIDRRKYASMEELFAFINSMPEDHFLTYQQNIYKFMVSDASYQFSPLYFAKTIRDTIVSDLGI